VAKRAKLCPKCGAIMEDHICSECGYNEEEIGETVESDSESLFEGDSEEEDDN